LATVHERYASLAAKKAAMEGLVDTWKQASKAVEKLSEEAANDTTARCANTTDSCRASYRALVEEHGAAKAKPVSSSDVEAAAAAAEVLESDEEPEEVATTIEVETVASWKKAYCDWV
jgi:sugar (pentulose or hexulose) kinase